MEGRKKLEDLLLGLLQSNKSEQEVCNNFILGLGLWRGCGFLVARGLSLSFLNDIDYATFRFRQAIKYVMITFVQKSDYVDYVL